MTGSNVQVAYTKEAPIAGDSAPITSGKENHTELKEARCMTPFKHDGGMLISGRKRPRRVNNVANREKKHGKWQWELLGWDDGNVYVYHEERGNFSVKKHPTLHNRLVAQAVRYFEQQNVKSEEELAEMMPEKRNRRSNVSYAVKVCNVTEPNRCGVFNMLVDPSSPNSVVPATELEKLKIKPYLTKNLILRNGRTVKRSMGPCKFELKSRIGLGSVVFGQDKDGCILGIATLTALGFAPDPKTGRLTREKIRM